jgi:Ca-activated chloride channel homolog
MIKFAHPEYLIYLLALPLVAALLVFLWMRAKKRMKTFADISSLNKMISGRSRVKFWLRGSIYLLALAMLIIGMANPQIGTKYEEVTRTGIDLIVAIDVSNSMLAQDIKPSRIDAAKRELNTLIGNLKGDRIGIIVFAGSAYTHLPLTSDYSAAQLLSDVIYTGIAPKAGTSIASAIELARESFKNEDGKYKAMVIITDGENHEDNPFDVAEEAADEGITVHTIGMGSTEGAPIPTMRDGRVTGQKRDREGNTVITRLDADALQKIADATGGTFTRASNAQDNLGAVFTEIEKMEKKDFGSKEFTAHEDRFQFLLAAGILLLILELIISEKRNRFLSRFALFAGSQE